MEFDNSQIETIYKLTVDYCKDNNLIDYEVKKPLICYLNRNKFCQFLTEELTNNTKIQDVAISNVDELTNNQ